MEMWKCLHIHTHLYTEQIKSGFAYWLVMVMAVVTMVVGSGGSKTVFG